jgi:dCTP deaminase
MQQDKDYGAREGVAPDERCIPYGILPDWAIRRYVPITPFEEGIPRPGKISWGLSSFGYDVRVGYKFKVFSATFSVEVDPKRINARAFVDVDLTPKHQWEMIGDLTVTHKCRLCGLGNYGGTHQNTPCPGAERLTLPQHITIPPNSYALAESVEHFDVPADVQCLCVGKSTYARAGIIVNVTPLEAAWRGKVTIEISNSTPLPVRVYAGEGVMQVLFLRGERPDKTYADKRGGAAGKYQDQTGLTLPTVDQ